MGLFPKNIDFFKLFDAQVDEFENIIKIVRALKKDDDVKKHSKSLKKIEHRVDEATHNVIRTLNQTFITPIDREDIKLLADQLDNIVDELDRAVCRMYIYKINPLPAVIHKYGAFIEKALIEVSGAVKKMKNKKSLDLVLKHLEKINYIENRTDVLHRRTLKYLFEEEKDPIMIVKLREIYESLENVVDCCEDVSNVLETIIVKNI